MTDETPVPETFEEQAARLEQNVDSFRTFARKHHERAEQLETENDALRAQRQLDDTTIRQLAAELDARTDSYEAMIRERDDLAERFQAMNRTVEQLERRTARAEASLDTQRIIAENYKNRAEKAEAETGPA